MEARGHLRGWFSPSTVCGVDIELRSSGLPSRAFTSWPTVLGTLLSFKGKIKEWPCLCPFSFTGLFIFPITLFVHCGFNFYFILLFNKVKHKA